MVVFKFGRFLFSGDCVECMACSDNVVRAGLTGKFKDVTTLVEMLDYTPTTAAEQIMSVGEREDGVRNYRPPVRDFAVDRLVGEGCFEGRASPEIVLCTDGSGAINGVEMKQGSVVYIVPYTKVQVTGDATFFAAHCQD